MRAGGGRVPRRFCGLAALGVIVVTLAACDRGPSSPDDRTIEGQPQRAALAEVSVPALAERLRALPRSVPVDRPDAIADEAIALLTGGRDATAEAVLRTALHDRPQDARLQLLMAVAVQRQRRHAEALRWFDGVLDGLASTDRGTPEVDQLPHFLGWCLYYLGMPAHAEVAFREHLHRVGDEADSLFALGILALDGDRPVEAEQLLLRSIASIDPAARHAARDRAKAHVRLGDVYIRLERLDDAERHLREGVALHADLPEGWAKLARLLHRSGRTDDAAAAQREHDEALRRLGRG